MTFANVNVIDSIPDMHDSHTLINENCLAEKSEAEASNCLCCAAIKVAHFQQYLRLRVLSATLVTLGHNITNCTPYVCYRDFKT